MEASLLLLRGLIIYYSCELQIISNLISLISNNWCNNQNFFLFLDNKLILPSSVVNGVAFSKVFQILYRKEDIEINDVFLFKVNMLVDILKVCFLHYLNISNFVEYNPLTPGKDLNLVLPCDTY